MTLDAPKKLVLTDLPPTVKVGASLDVDGVRLGIVTDVLDFHGTTVGRVQVVPGTVEDVVSRLREGVTQFVDGDVVTDIHGTLPVKDEGVLHALGTQNTPVLQVTGLNGGLFLVVPSMASLAE